MRRPRGFGPHALALTPARKLVLVKLRYVRGWRAPGGGSRPNETPEQAVLRELREEIGLIAHGRVELAAELDGSSGMSRRRCTLLIVHEVEYRPSWNWEVEQVGEFALNALPPDTAELTRRWIDSLRSSL